MFENVPAYSGDSILSLMEEFKSDLRAKKVNLSIGIYYDDDGQVPLPRALRIARDELNADAEVAQTYLPMSGLATLNFGMQKLLFGANSSALHEGRIVTIQTIGGSGALKVASDFLHSTFPEATAWVSQPTWDNHIGILEGAGFKVSQYPYFNPETSAVDFSAMTAALNRLPPHSVVLLHPCCHNPTGADLSNAQWDQIVTILRKKNLVPFLDIAYQGFGSGMEEDAYLIHALQKTDISFLVCSSFSKICSVYGDRVGGLSVVCASVEEAERVSGQLQAKVRRNYSSPPAFGARLVSTVLSNDTLLKSWKAEVENMRQRILTMREALHQALTSRVPDFNFDYLVRQSGMFSYTGMTPVQVQSLRDNFGIYLVRNGRLCISGLRLNNVELVADAIACVLKGEVKSAS